MSASTIRFLQQENTRLKAENEMLKEENVALRSYMNALQELQLVTQQIVSEENLFGLLDKILYSAMNVLRAEDGSLLLLDEETNELAFVLVHGDIRHQLRGYRLGGNEGIAGWVATNRQPLIVNNPRQDWRFSHTIDTTFGFQTRSIVCVPMIARGKLVGVIELLNKIGDELFAEVDVSLLSILALVAATALEEMRERLEAEESGR
jgi:GAF domain-containing protein